MGEHENRSARDAANLSIADFRKRLNHLSDSLMDIVGEVEEVTNDLTSYALAEYARQGDAEPADPYHTNFGSEMPRSHDVAFGQEPEPGPPITAEEWYGGRPWELGQHVHRLFATIRDAFDLTWERTAALVEAAPEYQVDDAPEPLPTQMVADLKYGPRWYNRPHMKHGGHWYVRTTDTERLRYAADAAQYWIERFGLDAGEGEEEAA